MVPQTSCLSAPLKVKEEILILAVLWWASYSLKSQDIWHICSMMDSVISTGACCCNPFHQWLTWCRVLFVVYSSQVAVSKPTAHCEFAMTKIHLRAEIQRRTLLLQVSSPSSLHNFHVLSRFAMPWGIQNEAFSPWQMWEGTRAFRCAGSCWELLGVSQVSALWHGQETYKQLSVFHYICWTLSPNFMSLLDAKRLWHRQVFPIALFRHDHGFLWTCISNVFVRAAFGFDTTRLLLRHWLESVAQVYERNADLYQVFASLTILRTHYSAYMTVCYASI
jgi:hypothetical protein